MHKVAPAHTHGEAAFAYKAWLAYIPVVAQTALAESLRKLVRVAHRVQLVVCIVALAGYESAVRRVAELVARGVVELIARCSSVR